MSERTVARATFAGIGVFITGLVLYLVLSRYEFLRLVLLGTPALAGFVAAYFSPRWKFLVGMSMALYGAIFGELMARGFEYFGGHVDHIGNLVTSFLIRFGYHAVFCFVGSLAGVFLSRARASKRRVQ